MKKIALYFFLTIATIGYTQHSISGSFSPAKDFKWLIAYELTPEGQRYVADTAVKEGHFKLDMPSTAVKGTYRLVYAVPQDEFYLDVLYNGKEDIAFNFSLEEGVSFIKSEENKLFNGYFSKINETENKLIDFYQNGKTSKSNYLNIIKELSDVQSTFEALQTTSLAHKFITANKPYIPDGYESVSEYFNNKKKHYFDYLKIESPLLQASEFLKDKVFNYIFTALPLNIVTQLEMETAIQENIRNVSIKLKSTPDTFQIAIFHNLWKTANTNTLNSVADFIYNNYLKELATKNGQQQLLDEIGALSRLRIGALCPEITWEKNGEFKSLSSLPAAENYILIFWSSTCTHCLKELPPLHKALKNYANTKVIAVGLEEDTENWIKESEKLPAFEHAIALGKWESDYAQFFNIHQTPTYFILDKNKRFIAKPENDKGIVAYLKDN